MIRPTNRLLALLSATGAILCFITSLRATPYASNVTRAGASVSFILNEPADTLKYSVNGGSPVSILDTTKGTKTFNLGSPSDTFSIIAEKDASTGYAIPTGALIQPTDSGSLAIATNASGLNLISSDANSFSWYGAPRSVGVSNNPNASNFGTVYISQGNSTPSLAPPSGPGVRFVNDGIYALHADESDAFGYGDTGQNPLTVSDNFPAFSTTNSNSPYHVTVGQNGDVFVADFSDGNANAFVINPNLTTAQNLFEGWIGTTGSAGSDGTSLPVGQNHGSVVSVYTQGSLTTNDLVVYTMDEDLTSAHVSGVSTDSTMDKHSVWKYTIGGTMTPIGATPVKVAGGLTNGPVFADMDIGADGKVYMSENGAAAQTRLLVTDANGNEVFNSLTSSQGLGSPTDILTNLNQIAVSPDQKWLAGMLNFSDVLIIPLVNGIPDLARRLVVDSGNVNSGRDIAFDAADNIYYVSSGQQLYRILSPGGHTITSLTWTGTSYTFASTTIVPEPATTLLVIASVSWFACLRRSRKVVARKSR